jgi:hypothetical protein
MSARSLHRPTSLYSPFLLLLPFFLSLPSTARPGPGENGTLKADLPPFFESRESLIHATELVVGYGRCLGSFTGG